MPAASPAGQHAPFTQILPREVATGFTWFGRARSYPIFSPSWYRYRSLALLAGCVIAFLFLGAMLGQSLYNAPAATIDWVNVAYVVAVFLLPLLTLCLAGPGLAVLARRRGLARFETAALLAALLLGIMLSAALFAGLRTLYEQPRHDAAKGMTVARFMPHIRIEAKVEDGGPRVYGGVPQAAVKELDAAVQNLVAANAAAAGPVEYIAQDSIHSEADAKAFKDMEMLDTGSATVLPARRAEIIGRYRAAADKLRRHGERMALLHGDPTKEHQATPRQKVAIERLAAATARMSPDGAPGRERELISRQVGELAITVMAIGFLLLLAWLGGLVDLIAFVRQRGRLADVLAEKELQRARAARNEAELRLSVLAAQVEPHFLFNTLASVRSAIDSDPRRAGHIVDHMVAFLRSSIPQMRDDAANATVTLASQLHMARCYLALMHERMPRLQCSVDADPALDAAQVPPLMLISLVENAVKHGVEPKIGPAHIAVRAHRVDAEGEPLLEISVSDDGVGFGEAASGGGIGLANIQERLRSHFGQRASLTLKALPEGGIAAILRVPLSFDH